MLSDTAGALRKLEEVFNAAIQRPSDFQCENCRGHIYAILDGIDAFAGYLSRNGQILLGHVGRLAMMLKAIEQFFVVPPQLQRFSKS